MDLDKIDKDINQEKITSENYLNSFIDLFKKIEPYEGKFYIGSIEQTKLRLQLKLNRFIPTEYVQNTINNLISSKIIINTNKKEKIGPNIGGVKFKTRTQRLYKLLVKDKSEISVRRLIRLFSDINDEVKILTTEEEIEEVKRLEKEKNIDFRKVMDIPAHKSYYNRGGDYNILRYYYPREAVLEVIERLKKYKEAKNDYDFNEYFQLKKELKVLLKEISNNEGVKMVTIYRNYMDDFEEIGKILPDKFTIENNKILFFNYDINKKSKSYISSDLPIKPMIDIENNSIRFFSYHDLVFNICFHEKRRDDLKNLKRIDK